MDGDLVVDENDVVDGEKKVLLEKSQEKVGKFDRARKEE